MTAPTPTPIRIIAHRAHLVLADADWIALWLDPHRMDGVDGLIAGLAANCEVMGLAWAVWDGAENLVAEGERCEN